VAGEGGGDRVRELDEKWATPWTLSMGCSDGSGIEPYGYPGDDAVAIGAQCR